MHPVMSSNSYGKQLVRMTKLTRHPDGKHDIRQLSVNVELFGAFERSYTHGDNRDVVATDTIKNTVYALGSEHQLRDIETFGTYMCNHFLMRYSHVGKVRVWITQELWDRAPTGKDGKPHNTAFVNRGAEKRTTFVEASRSGPTVVQSGIYGLQVLRSAGSEWANFHSDEFRTLADTKDRIFATVVDLKWRYNTTSADFDSTYAKVRSTFLDVFSNKHSPGAQHTIYHSAEAILRACKDIEEVHVALPNKHHVPFDLTPLGGRKNRNEIFVATDEPHGYIKASLTRHRSKL